MGAYHLYFGYYSHPIVSRLQPSRGLVTERTKVILSGTGFRLTSQIRCRLKPAPLMAAVAASSSSFVVEEQGHYISPTEIQCTIGPTGVPQIYSVEISLNGQDFAPVFLEFRSFAPCYLKIPCPVQSSPPHPQGLWNLEQNPWNEFSAASEAVSTRATVRPTLSPIYPLSYFLSEYLNIQVPTSVGLRIFYLYTQHCLFCATALPELLPSTRCRPCVTYLLFFLPI